MSISTPAPTTWGTTGNSTSSKRADFAAAVRDRLGRLNGTTARDSEPDSCREVLDTSGRATRDARASGRLAELLGLTGSRLLLPGRSRTVLAVLLLFVAVTVGAVAWFSWPSPQPATEALAVAQTRDDDSPKAAKLKVSVVGDVAEPGIVEIASGSRVADAIEAAGGLAPESATPGYLNLARKVKDGELIVVEAADPDEKPEAPADTDGEDPPTDTETPEDPEAPNGPVNINEATAEELATLPGIGPVTAASIIDYREQNGGFDSVEQLTEVDGIGPATLDKLADKVTV